MKPIQILLFISPLFVFAILFTYAMTMKDILCVGDTCEVGEFWAGALIVEWIVFYGVPASGYLIYRKIKQKKKQGSK